MQIKIKTLLMISMLGIIIVYYTFLPTDEIYKIVTGEYIVASVGAILIAILSYFKYKLKGFNIISYIPNTHSVDLKSTIAFFLLFQAIDFYYEDGFIGMISQWFIYWIFGLIAWVVTININLYKNYRFYIMEKV